ncbi:MAG: hypothetical protein E6F95_11830 [Actinobacteria bacterium]|nr:MAG: hypothetical protein E6F95_11830 [Actinomycetota bacterium]
MPFDEASARAATALDDGSASERFARMVEAQGGDPRVTEDPASVLPRASVIEPLLADRTGVLGAVDAEAIGMASRALGAGRVRKGEEVDPAVGIVFRPKIGDRIDTGEPLGEIHARSQDAAEEASRRTLEALTVGEAPVEPPPLIHGWFPPEGGR